MKRWLSVLIVAVLPAAVPHDIQAATREETVRVGSRPAQVRDKPSPRAAVVHVLAPGTEWQAFDREGDWVWIVVWGGSDARTRAGWVHRGMLVTPGVPLPVPPTASIRVAASPVPPPAAASPLVPRPAPASAPIVLPARTDAPASGPSAPPAELAMEAVLSDPPKPPGMRSPARGEPRVNVPRTPSPEPPQPVGGTPSDPSGLGDWIQARSLRAAVGVNYQAAGVRQTSGTMDDQLLGGGATVATSFAILDPRILTVDFSGDFQLSRHSSDGSLASFRNATGLRNFRVDLGVLTGRQAPLRLYADRLSSSADFQPSGNTLDQARQTRGVRSGAGFRWDLNAARLPRIQVSASAGHQLDERNYLFGYSSINDERRAEVRAGREHDRLRYQLEFSHGDFLYDVPGAGVRSRTGSEVFDGMVRLTPASRLTLDLHARATSFRFDVGGRDSAVSGAGADLGAVYQLGERVSASGRYSFSNNAFEAALSGRLSPGQPGATPVTTDAQVATRTVFQDGEARLEFSSRRLTTAAVFKGVSFGVPSFLPTTLSALTTAGAEARIEREWHGASIHAQGDFAAGPARSNRGVEEGYLEGGVSAGVVRDAGTRVRFGVDAGVRRTSRLSFFPVNLHARNATFRVETIKPVWARLRAAATAFDNLRDILYADARDRHAGYSVGISGPSYDLAVDFNTTDTWSLLLAPGVLGGRPDMAALIAARPEMFRDLLAGTDRSQLLSIQVRPFAGLQLQGRGRRQEQTYPGLFGFQLRGVQAWASYQIREVLLEFGWESFESVTSFGNVSDRRFLFRLRRDVLFF